MSPCRARSGYHTSVAEVDDPSSARRRPAAPRRRALYTPLRVGPTSGIPDAESGIHITVRPKKRAEGGTNGERERGPLQASGGGCASAAGLVYRLPARDPKDADLPCPGAESLLHPSRVAASARGADADGGHDGKLSVRLDRRPELRRR